jgi:hypothetical protein
MNEISICGTYLTARLGDRTISASLRRNPADWAVSPGSYRVVRLVNSLKYGDIVLLSRGPGRAGQVVDGFDNTPLFAIKAQQGAPATEVMISSQSISGVSSLVMVTGLPGLIEALRTAPDVVVQVT